MSDAICVRRFLALLFILASAATSLGVDQVRFAPPARYPAGTQPKAVAVLDLDHDGNLDIVTGSPTDQKVYVLLGKSDGRFQPAIGYATANASPMAVVLGDFTGDGKPDIAVVTANWGGSYPACMVLPGNGDGTFGAPIVTPVNLSPMSATAVDVNGDGKLDLVIGGNASAAVVYGNGDGTFRNPAFTLPPPPATNGDPQWAIGAADLNRDGYVDVFTGSYGGHLTVYIANSDGTFQSPMDITALDPGFHGITSVAAADLNGDAWPDIVGANSEGNASVVLTNHGDGTFTVDNSGYGGSTPTGIAVADFNGDGKPEIAFSDFNTSTFYAVADNFGVTVVSSDSGTGGSFLTQFDAGNHAGGIAVGDFNGDGLPDVVTTDAVDNAVSVLLNGAAMNVTASATPNPALPGETATFLATVAPVKSGGPAPTGTVTFLSNDQVMGVAPLDAGGIASFTKSFPLPASGSLGMTISALYSGDQNYPGSSDTGLYFQVGYATITTLAANPAGPVNTGSSTTLISTVTSSYGSPTGSVRFSDSGTAIALVPLTAGTASLVIPALSGGLHNFRASYVPDSASRQAALLSSYATITVVVGIPTTISLNVPASATAGNSLALTATLNSSGGTPTGTVTFKDGASVLGAVAVTNAAASFTVHNISAGAHSFTAIYSGDAAYTGSATAAATTMSVAEDFMVSSLAPAPVTLAAGKQATFTISVAPQPGGFLSPVQFSCSGLPALASCTFSPQAVTPATAAATANLTISTTAPSTVQASAALGFGLLPTLLPLGIVIGGRSFTGRKREVLAIGLVVLLAIAMIACGGGNSSSTATTTRPGTPAGTYTVTVLAQSGQTTHSTTVTVTVQ